MGKSKKLFFYRFVTLLAVAIASAGHILAQDISGTYVENGMTRRASAGLPSSQVSLCGLLSRAFDPRAQQDARDDRTIRISVQDDLLLEVFISGGLPGSCIISRTKSEGLRVGSAGVTFVLKDRKWEAKYHLSRGDKGRLLVSIDAKSLAGGPRLQGLYAFPSASALSPVE